MSDLPYKTYLPGLAADSIPVPPSIPEQLLALLNAERAKVIGLPLLRGHWLMDRCANIRVADMIAGNYFAHEDPDQVPGKYYEVMQQQGITAYRWAGENLGLTNADNWMTQLVGLWMASPGHRANVLSPEFDTVGTGHGLRFDGVHIVANIFVGGANLP